MAQPVSSPGILQRWLDRRWLLGPLALVMAAVSIYFLWALSMDYPWGFWRLPKVDPNLYTDPQAQWRYTAIDAGILIWCLVGVVGFTLSLWSMARGRRIAGWTYRAIVTYLALFLPLAVGISMMAFARSHGF